MAVNISQGQLLDFVERIPANIPYHIVSHTVIGHVHDPLRDSRDYDHDHAFFCQHQNTIKIHFAFGEYQINCFTCKNRKIQCQRHTDRCQNN